MCHGPHIATDAHIYFIAWAPTKPGFVARFWTVAGSIAGYQTMATTYATISAEIFHLIARLGFGIMHTTISVC